ncbi:MAG: hypothetical protein AAGB04_11075 [Pseudomonadota bacterium]
MGFRTSVVIMVALVLTFLIGGWIGDLILPGSTTLGAIIGGLILGGGVLYFTRNIGR